MNVEVVIPWRGGCEYRERALKWVTGRYRWPFTIAESSDGPWCKAAAVMPAVHSSTANIIVVADADVWCDGTRQAVQAVQDGASWATPHLHVRRLTEEATRLTLDGMDPADLPTVQPPYPGIRGGGLIVAPRDVILSIPPDPRFVGWGQEDTSWAIALHTLAGPGWRGQVPLTHLWHPSQPRRSRRIGSLQGKHLHRRYIAARKDPATMRALLEEVAP